MNNYFKASEEIVDSYMDIYHALQDGSLSNDLVTVYINPLRLNMVAWSESTIIQSLRHVLVTILIAYHVNNTYTTDFHQYIPHFPSEIVCLFENKVYTLIIG